MTFKSKLRREDFTELVPGGGPNKGQFMAFTDEGGYRAAVASEPRIHERAEAYKQCEEYKQSCSRPILALPEMLLGGSSVGELSKDGPSGTGGTFLYSGGRRPLLLRIYQPTAGMARSRKDHVVFDRCRRPCQWYGSIRI